MNICVCGNRRPRKREATGKGVWSVWIRWGRAGGEVTGVIAREVAVDHVTGPVIEQGSS